MNNIPGVGEKFALGGTMSGTRKYFRNFLAICTAGILFHGGWGATRANASDTDVPRQFRDVRALLRSADAARTSAQNAPAERDGQHDFDWAAGSWKIHLKKLVRPLSGSTEWVEFDGTVVCRKIWEGRAEIEEFNVDSPEKNLRIQGLALRTYNPQSHQWSIYWANAEKGSLDFPAMTGEFSGERGEFYNQDVYQGRAIYTRFIWRNFKSGAPHFEQAYSTDGGKTWETNWITEQTRVTDLAEAGPPAAESTARKDGQRDFDYEIGRWNIHLKRLLRPLTGSTEWVEFDGSSVTQKVWGGNANLEEFETTGASGHVEGLTLRLYNPQSRQWSLYWANGKDGVIGIPTVGEFKNGRGEFFDHEPINGRATLVRYVWSDITPSSAHFEQSFSEDGGKTWEVNWITDQTRVK